QTDQVAGAVADEPGGTGERRDALGAAHGIEATRHAVRGRVYADQPGVLVGVDPDRALAAAQVLRKDADWNGRQRLAAVRVEADDRPGVVPSCQDRAEGGQYGRQQPPGRTGIAETVAACGPGPGVLSNP